MSTMLIDDKQWMSMADAARYCGVTHGRIWQLANDNVIRSTKAFGRRLVHRDDIERFKREVPKTGRPRSAQQ